MSPPTPSLFRVDSIQQSSVFCMGEKLHPDWKVASGTQCLVCRANTQHTFSLIMACEYLLTQSLALFGAGQFVITTGQESDNTNPQIQALIGNLHLFIK